VECAVQEKQELERKCGSLMGHRKQVLLLRALFIKVRKDWTTATREQGKKLGILAVSQIPGSRNGAKEAHFPGFLG